MEVSHLRIKVDSDGIAQTSRSLGGLGNSAGTAELKISKLTDSIKKLIGAGSQLQTSQQSATTSAAAQAAAFSNLNTIVGQMARMMQQLIAANNAYNATAPQLAAGAHNAGNSFRYKGHWGGVVVSTLKAMATATAAYLALNLAKNIVESADKWQNMNAKLTVVTGSQQNATRALQDAYEVAQRMRTPLESVTQLWTRLSPAMQRMGKSGEDTTRVVQSVATALQLSGATAAESSSAMLQLSQSFNAGRLNGAEFNSIAEAAPLILEAIALKAGKSREELKKMGSDGKITGKLMAEALVDIGPKWDEMFNKLPVTVGGALAVLKNRWFKEIGEMGKDTGFTQELVKAVRTVESLIPGIAKGLAAAFIDTMKWIDANRDKLQQIWDQVVGIASDIWKIGGLFGDWIKGIIGAGESVSFVASGLFGIRLMIAAAVDVTRLLAASFISVGADIAEFMLMPLALVVKTIDKVTGALAGLARLSAKVAELLGNEMAAKEAEKQAKAFESFGASVEGYYLNAISLGDKARSVSDGWMEGLRTGNTEVNKLLNSQKELNAEVAKAKTPFDPKAFGPVSNYKPVDEKAIAAAAKARKEHEDHADRLNNKLAEQVELESRLNRFGLDYDKISTGTKERIALEKQLHDQQQNGASEFVQTRTLGLLLIAKELEKQEQLNERKLEGLRAERAEEGKVTSKAKSYEDEALALENKVAAYGKAKGAVEELELAEARRNYNALATKDVLSEHERRMLEAYSAQLLALERIDAAKKTLGSLDAFDKLDKLLDPKKAERFGNAMTASFGKMGQAIGKVVDAMNKVEKRQSHITALKKELDATNKNDIRYSEKLKEVNEETIKAQMGGYADLAGAAKNFFDEKSKGYKALEAIEKAFRAFEMAMEIKSFLTKSGMIGAITSLFVTGEASKAVAAQASAATQVAAQAQVSAAGAVGGVINQSNGDPYTAFPRMAAMAAIMAALGYAVGSIGGKGGIDVAKRQAEQGTGTVFGDNKKKSESIANSIEILSENSDIALEYSSGMLASLRNIEASLTGATNAIIRNSGRLTGQGTAPNVSIGKEPFTGLLGLGNFGLNGFGFGKKVTQTIRDTGITSGNQSIQDILASGFQGQSYNDVETKKKRFGITYSRRVSRNFSDLDSAVEGEFTRIISGMVDSVTYAADALGLDSERVRDSLMGVSLALGDISLVGMTGEEIQEQLSAVFSAFGDRLVTAGFGPALNAYQQAGEGLLETAVRVASGAESATYALEQLGLNAIHWTEVVNRGGDVGAEIVRQTILMEEAGTGVGAIMEVLQGTAGELAETYADLLDVRQMMRAVGFDTELTRDLVRAAGGLDAMQDALEAYSEGFFTDAERNAAEASRLREAFAELGMAMPGTRAGFRSLIESLNGSGQDGLAMRVMLLAESFGGLMDAVSDTSGVDNARSALSDAYEREREALEGVKDKFEDLSRSMKDFRTSLITGDLSPLSNTERYATLKAQYESTASSAMSGDVGAIEDFESIASEFLQFSREYNASGAGYNADFDRVMRETAALEQATAGRATIAEQQLLVLDQQVDGLLTINESVLTVAQAVLELRNAMALSEVPLTLGTLGTSEGVAPTPSGESTLDYGQYGRRSDEALVNEIKALRLEVTQLRQEQAQQTAAVIGSNYDASERNAEAVVAGTENIYNTTPWLDRVALA